MVLSPWKWEIILFVCFGLALEDKRRIPAQSAVQFKLRDVTTINLKNPDQCSLSYYLITENLVKVLEQQNCH